MGRHPTRYGAGHGDTTGLACSVGSCWTSSRVVVHEAWLREFGKYMAAADPATGVPRWQLYVDPRPRRDQNYALWFLEEFFEYIRPPGFSFVDDRDEKKSSP